MLQQYFSYEAIGNVIDLESFKIRSKVIGKTKTTISSKRSHNTLSAKVCM